MAVITHPQHNLPLGWSKPNVSLTEQTQDEAVAALAELIVQVWEKNRQTNNPLEDKTDE